MDRIRMTQGDGLHSLAAVTDPAECVICGLQGVAGGSVPLKLVSWCGCPACGTYEISQQAIFTTMSTLEPTQRYRLSAATRQATERRERLRLSTTNIDELIASSARPAPAEAQDVLLDRLVTSTTAAGQRVLLHLEYDYPLINVDGSPELRLLWNAIADSGLANEVDRNSIEGLSIIVTPQGFDRCTAWRARQPRSAALLGPDVAARLRRINDQLTRAATTEEYQSVGLACREVLITLAQDVYDADRHPSLDGVAVSETDAKRMLEAYVAVELAGGADEELRAHAKASIKLALALEHKRTADFRAAALCVEATTSACNMIAIISGHRGA